MKKRIQKQKRISNKGLTLTEVIVTVAMVGTLTSIAIPAYLEQKTASCQGHPESVIAQAMMKIQAYNDEYRRPATGWSDLDKISTLMTSSGPASGDTFEWIELASCGYKLKALQNGDTYTFIAAQAGAFIDNPQSVENNIREEDNSYNVIGCLNTLTGASDIKRGDGTTAAELSTLRCSKS